MTLTKRPRRRYDDKFRANAVVMLEAAGYPDRKGALEQASKHLRVPNTTLHGWFNQTHNPAPADVRTEKRGEIADIIRSEIYAALAQAPNARPDASYRDLITGAAILVDKLQLLTGKPTEIHKVDNISDSDIAAEFNQLLNAARERAGRTVSAGD